MKITVHGPPGAGNRLIGRMLRAAPYHWDVTVMHLPGRWYDADMYVFTDRSTRHLIASIMKEGMTSSKEQAVDWILDARNQISKWIGDRGHRARYVMIDYEHLLAQGTDPIVERIAELCGVAPWDFDEELVDGDIKYHHEECDLDEDCSCL